MKNILIKTAGVVILAGFGALVLYAVMAFIGDTVDMIADTLGSGQ